MNDQYSPPSTLDTQAPVRQQPLTSFEQFANQAETILNTLTGIHDKLDAVFGPGRRTAEDASLPTQPSESRIQQHHDALRLIDSLTRGIVTRITEL